MTMEMIMCENEPANDGSVLTVLTAIGTLMTTIMTTMLMIFVVLMANGGDDGGEYVYDARADYNDGDDNLRKLPLLCL